MGLNVPAPDNDIESCEDYEHHLSDVSVLPDAPPANSGSELGDVLTTAQAAEALQLEAPSFSHRGIPLEANVAGEMQRVPSACFDCAL